SHNVASDKIHWPAPLRFSVLGLETLGYKKEVVLPLDVALRENGAAEIKLRLDYLVCAEICIPYNSNLALDLPAGPEEASSLANLVARYRAQVPMRDNRHGISFEGAEFRRMERGVEIVLAIRGKEPFVAPDVFMEGPDGSYFGRPKVTLSSDKRRAWLRVKAGGVKAEAFEKAGLIATLVDRDRSLEAKVAVDFKAALPDAPTISASPNQGHVAESTLLSILLLAVLGGLILNIMPCVLPVLSIKLLGAIGKSGQDRATVRAGFLASAAGIVFSFLLLAGFLIALKAGGMVVGWGIQFQQPVFLAFLTVVLSLFAYNLFGLYEITMPRWVGNLVAGQGPEKNLVGHFMTGALATLVATPCSAPFLGTAVGFALSRGWLEIVAVFAALGVGLAVPYLLVAAFPSLAAKLPRPGAWMIWVRKIMGAALAITVLWLLYVVASVIGHDGALVLLAFVLIMGAALGLRRIPSSGVGRQAVKIVIALSLAAVIFPATWERAPADSRQYKGAWQAFDQAEIKRLVADGKTVFVDVTADWCVTCQVNKKLVLDVGEVGKKLRSGNVVAMRADWTRPSDKISAYLAGFGRYGIPFNAVYGPLAPDGIALPELLTSGLVLEAFARASDKATDRAVMAR
ncbi:MAG: thioredoxin family protein, partial [Proteobacteria bacterium]|nr:thioredoxin family protein [Pseudomonadota bacterium]